MLPKNVVVPSWYHGSLPPPSGSRLYWSALYILIHGLDSYQLHVIITLLMRPSWPHEAIRVEFVGRFVTFLGPLSRNVGRHDNKITLR